MMSGRDVLVVDDDPDTVDVLCTILDFLGYPSRGAASGGEGLALLEHFEPALVLLDLGLPDIDGYEIARRIRERAKSPPFIVALTGWAPARERHDSLATEFDEFILKPADVATLRRVLAAAAARRRPPSHPSPVIAQR